MWVMDANPTFRQVGAELVNTAPLGGIYAPSAGRAGTRTGSKAELGSIEKV